MTTENTPILLEMLETLDETAETWTEIEIQLAMLSGKIDAMVELHEMEAAE